MPTANTVDAFVAVVTAGRYIDAINEYYVDDVKIYENEVLMDGGKSTFLQREQNMLDTNRSVVASLQHAPLVSDEAVAIAWRFVITGKDGSTKTFDEVAWQIWQDNKIVSEHFHYNPKQLM